jgi:hypothetical protein
VEKVIQELELPHKLTSEYVAGLGRIVWKCVWLPMETSLKFITYTYNNFF